MVTTVSEILSCTQLSTKDETVKTIYNSTNITIPSYSVICLKSSLLKYKLKDSINSVQSFLKSHLS